MVEYTHEQLAFSITSPRQAYKKDAVHRRKPSALHHLAFKVETRSEVDKAYLELVRIGAIILSEPTIHPESNENYYAVYFKDLQSIKYEIVCTSDM